MHCLAVYLVRDGVGYFTGLSINCDDVTDGNDGFCWNRNRAVVTKLETIKWCDPMATSTLVGIDMVSPPFAEGGMPAKQAACLPGVGADGKCAPVFKADGGQQ